MKDQNERLARYIEDVMFRPEQAELELNALTPETRPLGEALLRLGEWVLEADRFAAAIASGETAGLLVPQNETMLGRNLREVWRLLRYLSAELGRILEQDERSLPAVADVTQQHFEGMVQELQRRTSALENERNLFVQFTESASERIVVLDEENGEMLFGNRVARSFHQQNQQYVDTADKLNALSGCNADHPHSEWVHTVHRPGPDGSMITEHYQVHSIYIMWEKRGAIAHMFSDITEMQVMQNLALRDALTGTYNRAYAMHYLDELYGQESAFALAFVDVDYLKYCNDSLGHSAGDEYLLQVTAMLQQMGPELLVCRVGGDEFLVIAPGQSTGQLAERVEQTRRTLRQERFPGVRVLYKNFSYGVVSHTPGDGKALGELLGLADERMYQNKLENKRKNHTVLQDDRLS